MNLSFFFELGEYCCQIMPTWALFYKFRVIPGVVSSSSIKDVRKRFSWVVMLTVLGMLQS